MPHRPPSIIQHLNGLMAKHGWLSEDNLRSAARELEVPLHRVEGVASFYPFYRRTPPPAHEILVCRDLSCTMRGGGEAFTARLEQLAKEHEQATGERVELTPASCLGRCERAPAALVGHEPADSVEGVAALLTKGERAHGQAAPARHDCDPYAGDASRHYATVKAIADGGDGAKDRALKELGDSGLRGMGGAGFPTARKWGFVRGAGEPGSEKYVICNADESEPGTFKDREVMARLPHLVWEGVLIGAVVVGAQRGIIYIRHEYELERHALAAEQAKAQAVADTLGVTLEIFVSPGGYIMGEETALLEALEDRRGEPRNKPPFPGIEGLFGRPTLINNVETLAMTTAIVAKGAQWWKDQGVNGCHGLKFLSVSGDVERPGVYEVPMGTTVAALIERAGGVSGGKALAAFLPGGASSAFLPGDRADTPLDFDKLKEAGSTLGSGGLVAVAEGRDLVALGISLTRFFRNESCGKCVPCRVGSEKAVTLLEELHDGEGDEGTLPLLRQLDDTMAQTSICGLGQVALLPAMSIFRNFKDVKGSAKDSGAD